MSFEETVRPRLRLPASAAQGEVVEIKTLLSHPMESGLRRDAEGALVPRRIVTSMVARLNGEEVFRAEWGPGIAANPYQALMLRAEAPGELEIIWTDEAGAVWRETATIAITG